MLKRYSLLGGVVAGLTMVSVASAAPLAYTNDFSTTNFDNQSTYWSLNSGKLVNAASGSGTTVSYATIQVVGMESGSYTVSTQFTVTDNTVSFNNNNNASIGLVLFGGNPTVDGTVAKYLLADVSAFARGTPVNGAPGVVRLFEVGTASTNLATGDSGQGTLAINTAYTLKATVAEAAIPGTFNVSVALFNADGTMQFGNAATAQYTPVALPVGGYYTGVRTRYPFSAASNAETRFDSFSIAVPEPTAFGASGLVALALLRRRR